MNRYINENDKKMDELLQKYIAGNVIFQWLALVSNIVLMTIITTFIAGLIDGGSGIGKYNSSSMAAMVISLIVCLIVRAVCNIGHLRQ